MQDFVHQQYHPSQYNSIQFQVQLQFHSNLPILIPRCSSCMYGIFNLPTCFAIFVLPLKTTKTCRCLNIPYTFCVSGIPHSIQPTNTLPWRHPFFFVIFGPGGLCCTGTHCFCEVRVVVVALQVVHPLEEWTCSPKRQLFFERKCGLDPTSNHPSFNGKCIY